MLYLDSSALVKRYLREPGTEAVAARFRANERIACSALTYAEILTVLGRKYQDGDLSEADFEAKRDDFVHDWMFSLLVLEVDTRTMSALEAIVKRYPLKASDAVHLAAALWLRDAWRLGAPLVADEPMIEFGVSDRSLARIAADCGLKVFNPEAAA